MEGADGSALGGNDDDITKRACRKIGRCRPRKTPPPRASPSHGCYCDDTKSFVQQNRRKLDLNKPQIATRHTRIRIPRQSWIQHQSTAIRRRNPKAKEDKSKNNSLRENTHFFFHTSKYFGEDDKCIAIQSKIPVMAESLPSPSTSNPPRMDP